VFHLPKTNGCPIYNPKFRDRIVAHDITRTSFLQDSAKLEAMAKSFAELIRFGQISGFSVGPDFGLSACKTKSIGLFDILGCIRSLG
jgi:hypothetical protein